MASDTLELEEDASERRFWRTVLRWLWASLILLAVAGLLAILTAALGWAPYLLLATLGAFAGMALSLPIGGASSSRELTGLILGVLILPLVAAWLSGLAASEPAAFAAQGAALVPFFAYAAGALVAALAIARAWRGREEPPARRPPVAGPPDEEGGMP